MMKKFVLIPDSFKGTLTSQQVCDHMAAVIRKHFPQAEICAIPVADGGEGTCDAFLAAMSGEKRPKTVSGPFFEPVEAFYARLPDGRAVIEMAVCAGLPLAGERKDPEKTTTLGVGELIRAALDDGCREIILGLGGSATNDGGAGMAHALGVRFCRADGVSFIPTGGTLREIERIDCSGLDPRLRETKLTAMCDVTNPLCGENGAAAVFGPQKGADEAAVARLDAGLRHLAEKLPDQLAETALSLPGGGAAGGMGMGASVFLGAQLVSGITAVLDTVGFDERLQNADIVFTGEGRFDTQSLQGKVIDGVAARAKRAGVPVIAVVGDVGGGLEEAYQKGVSAVCSINRVAVPYTQARLRASQDLEETMDMILRLLSVQTGKTGG